MAKKRELNFVDLFSGIGGFHQAVNIISREYNIASKLILAADIDPETRSLYSKNYNHTPINDVRKQDEIHEKIKDSEPTIIFAGFPCQPFSHAGKQEGFSDEEKGNLFFVLEDLLSKYKPKFFLFENVYNLKKHDDGKTWYYIKQSLRKMNYLIPNEPIVISPNMIGHPELRKRVYIPGLKITNDQNITPEEFEKTFNDKIKEIGKSNIEKRSEILGNGNLISEQKQRYIRVWFDLLSLLDFEMVKPAWSDFWNEDEVDESVHPTWKIKLINKNKKFYLNNKIIIDEWFKSNSDFKNWKPSFRKFEWNAGSDTKNINDVIIQFRPSGIRCKKKDFLPTFVAMNQTPIIGGETLRYVAPVDILKIQGFENFQFENIVSERSIYRMIGNTVNVHSTKAILEILLEKGGCI